MNNYIGMTSGMIDKSACSWHFFWHSIQPVWSAFMFKGKHKAHLAFRTGFVFTFAIFGVQQLSLVVTDYLIALERPRHNDASPTTW